MTINSNVLFCKDTYNLTKGIFLMAKSTIDCNDAHLFGNNSGTGIQINGYDSSTIKNCQISNFTIGIHSNLRKESIGYGRYKYYYNTHTNIYNNNIKNNNIGIMQIKEYMKTYTIIRS